MPAASIAVVLATAQPFTKRLFDLFERPLRAWAVGEFNRPAHMSQTILAERVLTRSSRGFY